MPPSIDRVRSRFNMSQQGPILVVSSGERSSLVTALADANMFAMVEASWSEAARAVGQLQPAAVLIAGDTGPGLTALAAELADIKPYVPLVVIDAGAALPANALPFSFG